MESLAQLRKSFEYDDWANKEVLKSLERLSGSGERVLQLYSHIAAAQNIWCARLHHQDTSGFAVWPSLNLKECADQLEILHQQWKRLLNDITMKELVEHVVYRNTKGQEFKNTVQDILIHVINHSSYHRGQIAAEVRKAGGTPAVTDYIVFCRK